MSTLAINKSLPISSCPSIAAPVRRYAVTDMLEIRETSLIIQMISNGLYNYG